MKTAPWNIPDLRWVCENHPTKDQEHRLLPFFWLRCGGAGMPDPRHRWTIQNEIDEMIATYRKKWPHGSGFLTGSSLCGNKQGDSARFLELKKMLGED